ncbi:MAG: M50 family metallopeptidase [Clostridia bacterium]|nr:M50 family metallopeptidase [Clostridia bacterium]
MKQAKKKKKIVWQQYIGAVFMMLIGAVCGFVMAEYLFLSSEDYPIYGKILSLAGLFLGMYVAFFFHIIVHEAGHLLFGLMTGYKFSSFRIASFIWLEENGKLKMKRLSIVGTGGQCLMSPPDMKDGRIPIVLYNLGGSIINIIMGALFLIIYWLCPSVTFLSPLLLIFAAVGFMSAIMNGIPMRMGMVDNDGYNAFALSRNREALEAFWVQLKVAAENAKGIRLKDMPAEWFEVPTDEAMKNSMVATRGVFAVNKLMDEEKFEDADALMAHLLEIESGIVGLHRSLMICDRVFLELIGQNRREVAEKMLTNEQKKFMKAMKRFPSVLRCEYAVALLLGNDALKAEKIKNDFEKAAKSYPYPHEIDSERDLMRIAERKSYTESETKELQKYEV